MANAPRDILNPLTRTDTFAQGEPYGVIVSVQGTAPGPDFTYTVRVQDDAGPIEFMGVQPVRRDGFDYEALTPGRTFPVARYGNSIRFFIVEDIAVQECPSG